MLYFHKLGTMQSEDKIVFGNNLKRRYARGLVTEDQNYLIISDTNTTYGNELYVKSLSIENSELITIINHFDNIVDNSGNVFFMQTNKNAPNQKLVSFSVENKENWRTIIADKIRF